MSKYLYEIPAKCCHLNFSGQHAGGGFPNPLSRWSFSTTFAFLIFSSELLTEWPYYFVSNAWDFAIWYFRAAKRWWGEYGWSLPLPNKVGDREKFKKYTQNENISCNFIIYFVVTPVLPLTYFDAFFVYITLCARSDDFTACFFGCK